MKKTPLFSYFFLFKLLKKNKRNVIIIEYKREVRVF